MRIPFDRSGILEYEKRYFETEESRKDKQPTDESIEKIQDAVKKRRHLTKSDLKTVALWKVPTKRNTLRGIKLNSPRGLKQ